MWGFRPCPLDLVPFRWRAKAFFIVTRFDPVLHVARGDLIRLIDLKWENRDCFRDVAEIVSWSDCKMFNSLCYFCT